MNKIFNWTFGSIFRTLGRVIAYLAIGTMFALILSKSGIKIADYIPLGIVKISAKTINITSQQYSVYRAQVPLGSSETWTSYVSNGTQTTNNTDNYIILGFRTKFYSSGKYEANTQYQAKVRANTTPKMNYTNAQPNIEFSCYGSTSNSNYSPQQSLISSCQLVSVVIEEGNNFTDYIINFTPTTAIETVQFVILFDAKYSMTRINIDNTSTITTDTTTQDAINGQTEDIINNQNDNAQQIIENQNELLGNKCENLLNLKQGPTWTRDVAYEKTKDTIKIVNTTANGWNYYFQVIGNINDYVNKKVYFSSDIIITNGGAGRLQLAYCNDNCTSRQNIIASEVYHTNANNVAVYATIQPNNSYTKLAISFLGDDGQSSALISEVTYVRPRITIGSNKPYCEYGTYTSKQDTTNQELNNINDSLNDDDSSEAQNKASEFFGNFTTNTHGLTGIITAPLNAIQSLTSSTCSPLVLPLPFVNQNLTLPCMRQIYVDNFGSFMTIYDVITLGIISYWILVRIFALVKDFKNPDHDEIEVMDL